MRDVLEREREVRFPFVPCFKTASGMEACATLSTPRSKEGTLLRVVSKPQAVWKHARLRINCQQFFHCAIFSVSKPQAVWKHARPVVWIYRFPSQGNISFKTASGMEACATGRTKIPRRMIIMTIRFQNRKRYGSMRDSGICRGRRNAKKIALLESVSRRAIFYCVFRQN